MSRPLVRTAHLLAAIACLAVHWLPRPAVAAVLPSSSYSHTGDGSSSVELVPAPFVTSTGAQDAFSFSTLTYYFEVLGPASTAQVSIAAQLRASETFTGPGVDYFYGSLPKYDVFALLNVVSSSPDSDAPGRLFAGIGSGGFRGADGSDTGEQTGYSSLPLTDRSIGSSFASQSTTLDILSTLTLSTGTIYLVEMTANSDGGYNSPGLLTSTSTAFVDPLIAIDAGFAAANPGFSIVVSPDVGNGPVASVPEPSSWLALCVGLALVMAIRAHPRLFSRQAP